MAQDVVNDQGSQAQISEDECQTLFNKPKFGYLLSYRKDPDLKEKLLRDGFSEAKAEQILHRLATYRYGWCREEGDEDIVTAVRKVDVKTHSKELVRINGLRAGGRQGDFAQWLCIQHPDNPSVKRSFRLSWTDVDVLLDKYYPDHEPTFEEQVRLDEFIKNGRHGTQAIRLLQDGVGRPYIHLAQLKGRYVSDETDFNVVWMLAEQQFWLVAWDLKGKPNKFWAPEDRTRQLEPFGVSFSAAHLEGFPKDLSEFNNKEDCQDGKVGEGCRSTVLRVISDKGYKILPVARFNGVTKPAALTIDEPPFDGYGTPEDSEEE